MPQKGNNSFKNFIKFQNSKINNKFKVQNFPKITIFQKFKNFKNLKKNQNFHKKSKFQKNFNISKNLKNFKSVEHITDGWFVPIIPPYIRMLSSDWLMKGVFLFTNSSFFQLFHHCRDICLKISRYYRKISRSRRNSFFT